MRKIKRRASTVITYYKALIEAHEYRVAEILAASGYDVEFIKPRTTKTPDIMYRGIAWEIKSPRGKSSRTIENNIRVATKQSRNIIIDLSRIGVSQEKSLREIEKQARLLGKTYKIIVITKDGEILEIWR